SGKRRPSAAVTYVTGFGVVPLVDITNKLTPATAPLQEIRSRRIRNPGVSPAQGLIIGEPSGRGTSVARLDRRPENVSGRHGRTTVSAGCPISANIGSITGVRRSHIPREFPENILAGRMQTYCPELSGEYSP